MADFALGLARLITRWPMKGERLGRTASAGLGTGFAYTKFFAASSSPPQSMRDAERVNQQIR